MPETNPTGSPLAFGEQQVVAVPGEEVVGCRGRGGMVEEVAGGQHDGGLTGADADDAHTRKGSRAARHREHKELFAKIPLWSILGT